MGVFINGIGSISPQKSWDAILSRDGIMDYHGRMVQCVEPETDTGLEDKYVRRMSRLIRLGWTAAKMAMDDAGGFRPDAIVTGSGWGSVLDSEKFLLSIYRNKENFLPPTPFIQSTHNAVSAQIAMLLDNYEYNMSYAHRSFAFEQALLDSMMRLEGKESQNVLCGGFDEITPNQFTLYDRLGWWRKEPAGTLGMIAEPAEGSIAGEGFNFFCLQNKPEENTYAELKWVETIITKNLAADSQIIEQLKQQRVDWVFAGLNGDLKSDRACRQVIRDLFPEGVNLAVYKHLCGEYLTAAGYALYAAARAIKAQRVPEVLKISAAKDSRDIRNILIYNQFQGTHHSFILLSSPGQKSFL